jgi:hypothetical protein
MPTLATPTQTGIVNAALVELGSTTRVQSIASHPDASAVWDSMIRLLVASHPWNFALARAQLNESPGVPTSQYARAFALPADCLRWLPGTPEDDIYFIAVQEGDDLLTDAIAPLPVRYISAVKAYDVSRWPPHFVRAVECELAARIANAQTQSKSIQDKAEERAYGALKAAKRADGLASNGGQQRTASTAKSSWLQARATPYLPTYGHRAPGR